MPTLSDAPAAEEEPAAAEEEGADEEVELLPQAASETIPSEPLSTTAAILAIRRKRLS